MILNILAFLITVGVMGHLFFCVKKRNGRITRLLHQRDLMVADALAGEEEIETLRGELEGIKQELKNAHVAIETVIAHETKALDTAHRHLEMVLNDA